MTAPPVNTYAALLKDTHDRSYQDLLTGGSQAQSVVQEAIGRLPDLLAAGQLRAEDVIAFDAILLRPGPPPSPVRDDLSELNLAAARLIGDSLVVREAARVRAQVALRLAQALDPKAHRRALSRIAESALELGVEFDLASIDPDLIANLHLQAGNPFMASQGPTRGEIDRGLKHYLEAYRLKRQVGAPDVPRLQTLMTEAARFLAATVNLPTLDQSRNQGRLETAEEVLRTVGAHQDARLVRLTLLRWLVDAHCLEAAEELASSIENDPNLSQDQRRDLDLALADLLSQQLRSTAAIERLDAADIDADDRRWRYATTVRANALRLAGDLGEAERLFRQVADRVSKELADEPGRLDLQGGKAHVLTHLGIIAVAAGRIEEGKLRFAEADEVLGEHFHFQKSRLEFLAQASRSLWEAGQFDDAAAWLERAVKCRTRVEQTIADPLLREAFLTTWARLDQRQAAVLLRRGHADRAFEIVEDAKSRILRGLVGRRMPPESYGEVAREALRSAWNLARNTAAIRTTQLENLAIGDVTRPLVAKEVRRLSRHTEALQELLERRSVLTIQRGGPSAAMGLSVAQSAAALIKGAPGSWGVVSYFGSEEGLGVVVWTAKGAEGVWLGRPTYGELRDEVLRPLGRCREALATGLGSIADWEAALEKALRRLYQTLIAAAEPMLAAQGVEHLLIVPHRALHAVPFAALTDPETGQSMIDRYQSVSVVPAVLLAADLLMERRADVSSEVVVMAVGDTSIPLTTLEAALIKQVWLAPEDKTGPPTVLVGPDAHPLALFGAAPHAGVLHLACHGTWDPAHPSRSGLRLAPSPPGVVPVFQTGSGRVGLEALLTQLDLSRCRVAVLSACETALSWTSSADEPMSLSLTVLLAGSRSVVASLWPVADESTPLLMSELHRRLLSGQAAPAALACAQRWLRDLSPDAAVERFEAGRKALEALDVSLAVRKAAEQTLAEAIARVTAATTPPYHHPDHWSAFNCLGAGAA